MTVCSYAPMIVCSYLPQDRVWLRWLNHIQHVLSPVHVLRQHVLLQIQIGRDVRHLHRLLAPPLLALQLEGHIHTAGGVVALRCIVQSLLVLVHLPRDPLLLPLGGGGRLQQQLGVAVALADQLRQLAVPVKDTYVICKYVKKTLLELGFNGFRHLTCA
jgi:hypothetical protein